MEAGILLMAAGLSRRYREASGGQHKLLASLGDGETVFARSLRHAQASGLPVRVIVRPEDGALHRLAQAAGAEYHCVASGGLGESIAAGVAATARWPGWLVALADMPALHPHTYRQVASALDQAPSARAFYHGRAGHPVGFGAALFTALCQLRGDQGARSLLADAPPQAVAVNDPGCLWDIDLPAHLPQADQ